MFRQTGPYKLDTWVQDSVQIYVRNENYWLPEYFHYDRVEVRIVKDQNAEAQMWEKGELDYYSPDSDAIETYIDDPRMREASSTTVFHIDVNCQNPENPLTANLTAKSSPASSAISSPAACMSTVRPACSPARSIVKAKPASP